MARAPITDRMVGADWQIDVVVSGLPVGVTVTAADFYLKAKPKDPNGSALITRHITTVDTNDGIITQSGTTATLRFRVAKEDNGTLTADLPYYYRAYMLTSDGLTDVPAYGPFVPH